MKLSGEHISLRATEPTDVDTIYAWENNTDHWLVSDTVVPYSKRQILDFIENLNDIFTSHQMRFMIETNDHELAGCVDLFDFDPKNHRVGLGVLIDSSFRGKGYGREALALAVGYCFEMLEVNCIFADILRSNESSIKLFEGRGFKTTGTRFEWLWDGNGYVDQLFYQLLRRDEA